MRKLFLRNRSDKLRPYESEFWRLFVVELDTENGAVGIPRFLNHPDALTCADGQGVWGIRWPTNMPGCRAPIVQLASR